MTISGASDSSKISSRQSHGRVKQNSRVSDVETSTISDKTLLGEVRFSDKVRSIVMAESDSGTMSSRHCHGGIRQNGRVKHKGGKIVMAKSDSCTSAETPE